ncbi:Crp/Fnr family transcriptional regulator [Mucilaginibacter sp. X4EP1]|uniref:Crp/Fnr family transcriptional regulator n=1 Tax=Mucilaginibacter sp. X4EP1 TaxID=2723092 RepID=UPI00216825A8|nr:Crp/Fnr family transcriptional regulator [Mucilaginibacter sp. X4EP1]MCS3813405.1 CRP-like cAMP-binding protein [Mucilaginibacter sp. X4EP1]
MKQFLDYLHKITPLSADAQAAIVAKLQKAAYSKGEVLIKELSKCEHLFFIEKGLARAYYFKQGKEITDWFGLENSVIGPVVRHFPTKTGMHSVELLEDTVVISISFYDLQELYDKYHEIERLGRMIAIQTILSMQQKIDSMQFLTAKQRYHDFVKAYPSLLQRVSLGDIASYLGMNQVTMSRIRKI